MKKLLLLLATCAVAGGANAQFNQKSLMIRQEGFAPRVNHTVSKIQAPAAANRGTALPSRWYNQAEALGNYYLIDVYDATLAGFYAMWQDSSVQYEATGGGPSGSGINYLSIGQLFAPQSPIFNDPSVAENAGLLAVENNKPYTIDSIRVRGVYQRTNNSYVDTMIFTVVSETSTARFAYFSYGGSVGVDHGIDSFAAMLWSSPSYNNGPISQTPYTSSGNALSGVTFKVPMNNATFADSNTDGTHFIKVPVNITVPAGRKSSVSITFKSGTTTTPGSVISAYNFFAFLSHETVENGFVTYPTGDLNMSSIVYKDTAGAGVNSTLSIYTPSLAWTAPYGPEVHNIGFKVSCPTCNAVNIANINTTVNVGQVYPNPANNTVVVPVTMKETAKVNVSITNTIGQTLATQNLGQLSANATKNATFSTSALANGIYFLTVEANGARSTSRFVVAH